jgi:hypothetical protein
MGFPLFILRKEYAFMSAAHGIFLEITSLSRFAPISLCMNKASEIKRGTCIRQILDGAFFFDFGQPPRLSLISLAPVPSVQYDVGPSYFNRRQAPIEYLYPARYLSLGSVTILVCDHC